MFIASISRFKDMNDHKCAYDECIVVDCKLVCSNCKSASYCGREHQKKHWKEHKVTCKASSSHSTASNSKDNSISETSSLLSPKISSKEAGDDDKRQCRCMFCGEHLILGSEVEAVDHMRSCPALQEQLSSTEQFTIPSSIQKKVNIS